MQAGRAAGGADQQRSIGPRARKKEKVKQQKFKQASAADLEAMKPYPRPYPGIRSNRFRPSEGADIHGLRAGAEDFHCRLKSRGLVQRSSENDHHAGHSIDFRHNAGTAVWAEAAMDLLPGIGGFIVGLEFALNFDRVTRKHHQRFKGGSGVPLATATMAHSRKIWFAFERGSARGREGTHQ